MQRRGERWMGICREEERGGEGYAEGREVERDMQRRRESWRYVGS